MKLPCSRSCRTRNASRSASARSVFRPLIALTCSGLTTRIVQRPTPSSTLYSGFQYTPVASSAMCVTSASVSHAASASSAPSIVLNVRVSRCTDPPGPGRSTHATTVFLCTSSPAQRSCTTSMRPPPTAALGRVAAPTTFTILSCGLEAPGTGTDRGARPVSESGSGHQQSTASLSPGLPPSYGPLSHSRHFHGCWWAVGPWGSQNDSARALLDDRLDRIVLLLEQLAHRLEIKRRLVVVEGDLPGGDVDSDRAHTRPAL